LYIIGKQKAWATAAQRRYWKTKSVGNGGATPLLENKKRGPLFIIR